MRVNLIWNVQMLEVIAHSFGGYLSHCGGKVSGVGHEKLQSSVLIVSFCIFGIWAWTGPNKWGVNLVLRWTSRDFGTFVHFAICGPKILKHLTRKCDLVLPSGRFNYLRW